jgi:hypothetical protein
MISQLAECRAWNLNSPLFSRISRRVFSAQPAVASLRASGPFSSNIQISGLHHSSQISNASAKDSRAGHGFHRPVHIAVRHKPATQSLEIDDIPSDYTNLDGVLPEESLEQAGAYQSSGTLTDPSCGTAAYLEVGKSYNPFFAPLTASL